MKKQYRLLNMSESFTMAVSTLFIVFSVVFLKEVNCNPLFEVDDAKSDVKSKLLYLLSFTDLPEVVEEPVVDSDNKNFISAPSYEPSYKSNKNFHDYYYDYKEPKEEYSDKPYEKNKEEANPLSNFNSNEPYKVITTSSENYKEFDKFKDKNKPGHSQAKDESMLPYIQVYEEYPTSDLDHNYGLKHPGFYHHQHNHHLHHQHVVGCFPFGHPRPRPRPPPPRPTTAPTVPSIDPRVSTLASIISSKGPGIDIRVGRDTKIQDDVIVFPE